MHDDKDLDKKVRKENQKTDDDDDIFLTLAKLDSPELRKFLMLGIGLALVLIVLDWWQPILILGLIMTVVSGSKIVYDFFSQRFGKKDSQKEVGQNDEK